MTTRVLPDVANMVPPDVVAQGRKAVAAAGTRVQLDSVACKSAIIKALPANTGKVYVGDSTVAAANGFPLSAGEGFALAIDNLNRLYIDADVNGEGVAYIVVRPS